MQAVTARNIIGAFRLDRHALCILADAAYAPLARSIARLHGRADVRLLEEGAEASLAVSAPAALLLAEPESYLRLRLYERLDFTRGEPRLPGVWSKALIFPQESLQRVFSRGAENAAGRDRLLAALQPHCACRITTAAGTDLTFTPRAWLPLDFEVCTAPVEASVNGVIVADGALFFRRIASPLTFVIRDGTLVSVSADTPQGRALAEEYQRMTAREMADPVNRQLAEVGVGFCPGAAISDCFMEAEAAADTCHFCFGSNVFYGGMNQSSFHGASILIRQPRFHFG